MIICVFSLLSVSSECSSSTRYVQLYIQPAQCQTIGILCECTCIDCLVLLSAVHVQCRRSYVVGWVMAISIINECFTRNQNLIDHHVRSKLYLLQCLHLNSKIFAIACERWGGRVHCSFSIHYSVRKPSNQEGIILTFRVKYSKL